jgi:hypothetical protein
MTKPKNEQTSGEPTVNPLPTVREKALVCLGPPPLINGEDAKQYQQLLDMVIEVLKPIDILGHIWARDIADLEWDLLRFRRAKAHLIDHAVKTSWSNYACLLVRDEDDPPSAPPAPTQEDISTGVEATINRTERIDLIMTAMEARRDSAYREFQRHRASLVKRGNEDIHDAEFHVIEPAAIPEKKAA